VRYLIDTNVLSETRKKRPDEQVMAFLQSTDTLALHVSVLTFGELRKGAAIKARTDAGGAEELAEWIDAVELTFADRILSIDGPTARIWGELSADRSRPVVDTLLAATAMAHNMTLVTRNTKDMLGLEFKAINPWKQL
jgi:toxin FitB